MRSASSIPIGLLLLALVLPARAFAVLPAPTEAGKIPNITVWNESDQQSTLYTQLDQTGPAFLLPVYTHCTMSCPVLAARLIRESATLHPGYQVLIFSFDPAETAASLRDFRREQKLPATWLLVRSTPADIRRFTDYFHYTILTEGPVMIHTNQLFLLDHTHTWRATFTDEKWNAADLALWLHRAESPGIIAWFVMNPEKLSFIALGGLAVSLALILWALLHRPHPKRSGCPISNSPTV